MLYSTSPPRLADVPIGAVRFRASLSMSLPLLLIFGAALCGWALLRCIGNECDRRIRLIEERVRVEQAEQEAAAKLVAAQEALAKAFAPLPTAGGPKTAPGTKLPSGLPTATTATPRK